MMALWRGAGGGRRERERDDKRKNLQQLVKIWSEGKRAFFLQKK